VDEAHAAHIRRELVDLAEGAVVERECSPAVLRLAQVQQQELVGLGRREFVFFDVPPTDPIAFTFQSLY